MGKRLVVSAFAVLLSVPVFAARVDQEPQSRTRVVHTLDVQVASPLETAEAETLIERSGAELVSVSYEENGIVGGYVLSPGEDLSSAMANFHVQHEEFLAVMKRNLQAAMDANPRLRFEADTEDLLGSLQVLAAGAARVRLSGFRVRVTSEGAARLLEASQVSGVIAPPQLRQRSAEMQTEQSVDRLRGDSLKHETWAPSSGYSDVNQSYTSQTFYFNDVSGFDTRSTYECETQVYDPQFANFGGYWSSNMPRAYYDTAFGDRGDLDNFTVGCAQASSLKTKTAYYTFMTLKAQTAKTAQVRIKGQKGHRTPSFCYSTWCIFADATTSSIVNYTVPAGVSWQY